MIKSIQWWSTIIINYNGLSLLFFHGSFKILNIFNCHLFGDHNHDDSNPQPFRNGHKTKQLNQDNQSWLIWIQIFIDFFSYANQSIRNRFKLTFSFVILFFPTVVKTTDDNDDDDEIIDLWWNIFCLQRYWLIEFIFSPFNDKYI